MKTLIAYFSWSGNTEKIAKKLQSKTRGELYRIERLIPYSSDYNTCAYVEAKKEADEEILPDIKTPLPDISEYNAVIIAFPIWWYTMPAPVKTFLNSYPDWQGKRLYVFANAYSDIPSQFTNSVRDAIKYAKGASVHSGLYNKEISKLCDWAREQGYKV